jgi:hypothetical protein
MTIEQKRKSRAIVARLDLTRAWYLNETYRPTFRVPSETPTHPVVNAPVEHKTIEPEPKRRNNIFSTLWRGITRIFRPQHRG